MVTDFSISRAFIAVVAQRTYCTLKFQRRDEVLRCIQDGSIEQLASIVKSSAEGCARHSALAAPRLASSARASVGSSRCSPGRVGGSRSAAGLAGGLAVCSLVVASGVDSNCGRPFSAEDPRHMFHDRYTNIALPRLSSSLPDADELTRSSSSRSFRFFLTHDFCGRGYVGPCFGHTMASPYGAFLDSALLSRARCLTAGLPAGIVLGPHDAFVLADVDLPTCCSYPYGLNFSIRMDASCMVACCA